MEPSQRQQQFADGLTWFSVAFLGGAMVTPVILGVVVAPVWLLVDLVASTALANAVATTALCLTVVASVFWGWRSSINDGAITGEEIRHFAQFLGVSCGLVAASLAGALWIFGVL